MASQEKIDRAPTADRFSTDALVIDHESDLYAGSRQFCENHQGTQLKYDVCHKVACELKKRLNKNSLWEEMTSGAVQTKKALSLSKFAKFAPPQQRSKARYMNLNSLVKWERSMIDQYEILPKEVQNKVDKRLIGTTEVLEGLFGGYKRLTGENKMSLNGLGRLVLCMSSRVGEFSEDLVTHLTQRWVRIKTVHD